MRNLSAAEASKFSGGALDRGDEVAMGLDARRWFSLCYLSRVASCF